MREDQTKSLDGHLRRTDALPGRQFARALDCGGDGRTARAMRQPMAAWPAGRALGMRREGASEGDETPPDAA